MRVWAGLPNQPETHTPVEATGVAQTPLDSAPSALLSASAGVGVSYSVRIRLTDLCPCQDESNRSGGKWIIRLRKGLASRFWENIILAMLGEQFMVGEEICGAVVSIRFQVASELHPRRKRITTATPDADVVSVCQEDILSIWNRTSNDQMTTSRIRDTLRRVLNLPTNTIMEYKTHNDSLRYACG